MTIEELEALLASEWDREDRWNELLTENRLDPEACGIFCGRLAMHSLERADVTAEDAEWARFGPILTTVALCAFEAALRLSAARVEDAQARKGTVASAKP